MVTRMGTWRKEKTSNKRRRWKDGVYGQCAMAGRALRLRPATMGLLAAPSARGSVCGHTTQTPVGCARKHE